MYVDDNGITRFESTDNISPLHTALNTALSSVSDVVEDIPVIKSDVTNIKSDVEVIKSELSYLVSQVPATGGMTGTVTAVRWGPLIMLAGRLSGTLPSNGTIIAYLPLAYRPYGTLLKTTVGGSAVSNNSTRLIGVSGAGSIYFLDGAGGTAIDLDGVTYFAADSI